MKVSVEVKGEFYRIYNNFRKDFICYSDIILKEHSATYQYNFDVDKIIFDSEEDYIAFVLRYS